MTEGWDGWGDDPGFGPDEPHDGLGHDPLAHGVDAADGAAARFGLDWPDSVADEPGPAGAWAHDPPVHPEVAGGQPSGPEHHPAGSHDGSPDGGEGGDGGAGASASAPVVPVDEWDVPTDADVSPFPTPLGLEVSPTDGLDWVDARLLGAGDLTDAVPPAVHLDPPGALLADLHRLDAADGSPSWAALSDSDDPVVRALARFWQR